LVSQQFTKLTVNRLCMKITGVARDLLLVIAFFVSTEKVVAQLSPEDSFFYQKAVGHAIALYHQASGDQSGLFNGIQYIGYPFTFKEGHPFFLTPEWSTGSATYDGVYYDKVLLLYDEVAEVVIIQDAKHRLQLHSSKLSRFTVANNIFVRIEKDSLAANLERTGFYNLLYEGGTSVLKKEVKRIREEVLNSVEGVQRLIETKTTYYIKKQNEYYTVNTKKDVLNIFKDHRKDIQQYIKANNLSFKRDKDNLLIKVSAYYDQLTN
jgi:hypothetical protein